MSIISSIIGAWWMVYLSCALTGCGGSGGGGPPVPPPPPVVSRKPSVFQAWNGITNRPDLTDDQKLALHDLAWIDEGAIGLAWNGYGYRPEQVNIVPSTRYNLASVKALNPNLKILVQVSHRDLPPDWLPLNDPWWLRDTSGNRVPGWAEGGYFKLNQSDPTLQDHVAARARALMATGIIDGIMLDWFNPETPALQAIASKVRNAIGNGLLIVNANTTKLSPGLLSNVNGVFMENGALTGTGYQNALSVLFYNESKCRAPVHNCFENWRTSAAVNDPTDLANMTKTVTDVTKRSHAHVCFSHPNQWPEPDHLHEWYTIYEQTL